MEGRIRISLIIFGALILLGGLCFFAGSASATPPYDHNQSGTPLAGRPGPIPTVYPPSQADAIIAWTVLIGGPALFALLLYMALA